MTYQPQPTTTPPAPPSLWQKIWPWIAGVFGVIAIIGGISRLFGPFSLPSCDSSSMTATLQNIYRDQKVKVARISDIKTLSSTSDEVTCTGIADINGDPQAIDYRAYWEERRVKVAISSSLPRCESPAIAETIRNIYKGRNVEITSVSEAKTVSSSGSEHTCTARIATPSEQAIIGYRIFRQGTQTQVLITQVDTQPGRSQ